MELKKWTPNILKTNEMERLSVLDDDYDLESPNLDKQSKYNPIRILRHFWMHRPDCVCKLVAVVLAIIPFIVLIVVISTVGGDVALTTGLTDCDTSNAWAQSFSVQTYGAGVVAADDERCSKIGAQILSIGGNAMDAAISVALCLGVVSPASSGLGGGCFVLGYNATTKDSLFIDSREIAPAGSSQNMYLNKPKASVHGGLAVAIPAELKGLYLAWQTHGGDVTWNQIVTPSIKLAENWEISPTVARYILKISSIAKSNTTLYSTLLKLYFHADLTPKVAGEYVQNTALAATLTKIANEGPDALYGSQSTFPELLAQEIQAAGGIITADEIRSYSPIVRDAIEMDVFGYQYFGSPPPSSGGVIVGAILQFLSAYDEPIASQQGLYYHHLVEAMKHTFAIRMSLGDPDFVNVTKVVNDLVKGDLIRTLQELTREDHVLDSIDQYGGPDYGVTHSTSEDHGTSHISVLDKNGNAVAITSTINTYFGSLIVSPSSGIVFNNEMDDFSSPNASNYFGLAPFPANYIQPGKRPLSSMSPSILVRKIDGRVRLVGGASGGPRIITATAQVLLNFLGKGMSLLDAVIEPRIHSQLFPQTVYLEDVTLDCYDCLTLDQNGVPIPGRYQQLTSSSNTVLVNALRSRGHNITIDTGANFGVCQIIDVEYEQDHLMTAISDPRKGGKPAVAVVS